MRSRRPLPLTHRLLAYAQSLTAHSLPLALIIILTVIECLQIVSYQLVTPLQYTSFGL